MQSAPPARMSALFVCAICGFPASDTLWAEAIMCRHCAASYGTTKDCIVFSSMSPQSDSDRHSLLRVACDQTSKVYLIRTNQPDLFVNAVELGSAQAITRLEFETILADQHRALLEASFAIRSKQPPDRVRLDLTTSIHPYTAAVGIGASAGYRLFMNETYSVFVMPTAARHFGDGLVRFQTKHTPRVAELVFVLYSTDDLSFRVHGCVIFRGTNSTYSLDDATRLSDDTFNVATHVLPRVVDQVVHGSIECTRILDPVFLSEPLLILECTFPSQLNVCITVVKLPCLWLLLYNANDTPCAYVILLVDLMCDVGISIETTNDRFNMVVISGLTRNFVKCDKAFRGTIVKVTAMLCTSDGWKSGETSSSLSDIRIPPLNEMVLMNGLTMV